MAQFPTAINPWALEKSTSTMNDVFGKWAVGNDGLLMWRSTTLDGGQHVSWTTVDLGLYDYNLNAIHFVGNNGWIVGEKKDGTDKYKGILKRTINGGNNPADWLTVTMPVLPSGTSFKDVSFSNNGTGYIACGNGIILKSNDWGANWPEDQIKRPINDPAKDPNGISIWFQSIYTDPTNSANVRVVGDNYGFWSESTDGGATWTAPQSYKLNELPQPISYTWPTNTMFNKTLTLAPYEMGHSNWTTFTVPFNHGYVLQNGTLNKVAEMPIWFYDSDVNLTVGSDGEILNTACVGNNIDLYGIRGGLAAGKGGIYSSHVIMPFSFYMAPPTAGATSIRLDWDNSSEGNIFYRYKIYRTVKGSIGRTYLGYVDGTGSMTYNSYYYIDNVPYKTEYEYWIEVAGVPRQAGIFYFGSATPTGSLPNLPTRPATPTNVIATDVAADHGEAANITWNAVSGAAGYYVWRDGDVWPLGTTTGTSFPDTKCQNKTYTYRVESYNVASGLQVPSLQVTASVTVKDDIAPAQLPIQTGSYDVGNRIITLNWQESLDDPNFGGYWVCPEPVGEFASVMYSSGDPGVYEPDAYHVEHASPITRPIYKYYVPDEYLGLSLGFSVTAMDRSGNIAPWSQTFCINTKALTNSNTSLATAYNNGKHLIYDDKGRLFLVYTSEDSVLYQQSWDDGITWTPSSGFASGGAKPVPVIGYYGADTTMTWKAETENSGWILKSAKRVNNGWSPAETILEAIGTWEQTHYVSPPSMAINNAGTHLAIERVDAQYQIGGQSGIWYWKLLYGFKAAGQTAYAWTVLDSTSGSWGGQDPNLASPTICLDSKGGVHIAWDYEGEIYWRGYDPYLGAWKDKTNLTNSPEVFSAEPSLSFYGDVHLVWQEGNDIQHRKGNWGYPRLENIIDAITKSFYWQGVENVYNSPATASLNPVFDGNYVAWSEETAPGIYSAFYSNYADYTWQTPENYSKNPSQPSLYPQIAYRQNVDGNKMTTIWTEGTGPLYSLIARDAAGQVTAQATTDVGGEEASLYLIERDGYIVYGATDAVPSTGIITVDYDSTALEYYLPTLDRDQKQTMKFTFYQEYPGKIDYIYQVWVDNVSLGSVKVPSGKSVVFEKDLPNAVTHDGEGIVKIVNLKSGKIVTCDKWELYAYDKATGRGGTKKSGGVQIASSDSKPLTYVYAMAQNAPNPFNGQTRISYQLAKPGNVSLKIYNTLGQLVNTLVEGQQQPGIYSANWNGKDNSGRTAANGVYIYRLESGDFKATKKMVVLK